MKSRLNLKPGQRGTKKLVEEYGKSLLYVRYRYDEARGVRLKTVEIIIEEKPWQPGQNLLDDVMVPVQINFTETTLRDKVKAAGGMWDPEEKVWYIAYGATRGTELEDRIMMDFNKGKQKKHLI